MPRHLSGTPRQLLLEPQPAYTPDFSPEAGSASLSVSGSDSGSDSGSVSGSVSGSDSGLGEEDSDGNTRTPDPLLTSNVSDSSFTL